MSVTRTQAPPLRKLAGRRSRPLFGTTFESSSPLGSVGAIFAGHPNPGSFRRSTQPVMWPAATFNRPASRTRVRKERRPAPRYRIPRDRIMRVRGERAEITWTTFGLWTRWSAVVPLHYPGKRLPYGDAVWACEQPTTRRWLSASTWASRRGRWDSPAPIPGRVQGLVLPLQLILSVPDSYPS